MSRAVSGLKILIAVMALVSGCGGTDDGATADAGSSTPPATSTPVAPLPTASPTATANAAVGLFVLDSPFGTYRDGNLRSYDFVTGYAWRYGWSLIETAQNVYDFAALDYILGQLASRHQQLSWIIMPTPNTTAEPAYVLAQAATWVDKDGVTHVQPWDSFTQARYRAFIQALAAHRVADPAQGGAMVLLGDHSAFYAINVTFPGVSNLALRDKRDNLVDIPGYTRTGLQDAVVATLRTVRTAFPKQHVHFGFWKFHNDTGAGEAWQAMLDRVMLEFGNSVGLFMDNLAASRACVGCDPYVGSPASDFGAPLIGAMNTTYNGFQALTSWANPTSTSQSKVQFGTPMDGIDFGLKAFNSRYVELYVDDVDRTDWQDGLRASAATLSR